jgi:hypothetical protein
MSENDFFSLFSGEWKEYASSFANRNLDCEIDEVKTFELLSLFWVWNWWGFNIFLYQIHCRVLTYCNSFFCDASKFVRLFYVKNFYFISQVFEFFNQILQDSRDDLKAQNRNKRNFYDLKTRHYQTLIQKCRQMFYSKSCKMKQREGKQIIIL